jgi:hypothetical protein
MFISGSINIFVMLLGDLFYLKSYYRSRCI